MEERWPSKETLDALEKALASQQCVNSKNKTDFIPILEWTSENGSSKVKVNRADLALTLEVTEKSKKNEIARVCRQLNNNQQTQQLYWLNMCLIAKLLESLVVEKEKLLRPDLPAEDRRSVNKTIMKLKEDIALEEAELFRLLRKIARKRSGSNFCYFTPGPVGDLPIHDSFLLDLTDIGLRIIEEFFDSPQLVSLPYINDLDAWRQRATNEPGGSREDGLYTGETVLHIAIVKENIFLVDTLTKKGIDLSSRATGVFFQPRWIRPRVQELSRWQWFLAWAAGIDLKEETFAAFKQQLNEYYGYTSLVFLFHSLVSFVL